jgi:hypothetical protein
MTGIAVWTATSFETHELEQVDVEPFVEGLLKQRDFSRYETFIGIQRYAILANTHKKSRQPAASQIIGSVQSLGVKYKVTVDIQSASTAARFKNDTLRRISLYTPKHGHANDAARHVLVTLLTFRPSVVAELLRVVE